jgi:hypothetical protein
VGGCIPESADRVGLGSLLTLDDVELHVIALFQSFVTIQLDRRVVNENIWPVITTDESVALGVVEPFDLAFVLSHRVLPFLRLDRGAMVTVVRKGEAATARNYDAETTRKVY